MTNRAAEDIKIDIMNRQCAPNIKFEDGSCIKLDILITMATSYNSTANHNKKIQLWDDNAEIMQPKRYKQYLVEKLTKVLGSKQYEWYNSEVARSLEKKKKDELEKFTHLPEGPNGKNEWLNNIQIKEYLDMLERTDSSFKCVDVLAMDFEKIKSQGLQKADYKKYIDSGRYQLGFVFNLDNHDEPGSHWVALYANLKNNIIVYYDSYGIIPEVRVRRLMRRLADFCAETNNINISQVVTRYNKNRHQYKNSECGVYSIAFISNLIKKNGQNYDEYCKTTIPDGDIELCRGKYFRNGIFSVKMDKNTDLYGKLGEFEKNC